MPAWFYTLFKYCLLFLNTSSFAIVLLRVRLASPLTAFTFGSAYFLAAKPCAAHLSKWLLWLTYIFHCQLCCEVQRFLLRLFSFSYCCLCLLLCKFLYFDILSTFACSFSVTLVYLCMRIHSSLYLHPYIFNSYELMYYIYRLVYCNISQLLVGASV